MSSEGFKPRIDRPRPHTEYAPVPESRRPGLRHAIFLALLSAASPAETKAAVLDPDVHAMHHMELDRTKTMTQEMKKAGRHVPHAKFKIEPTQNQLLDHTVNDPMIEFETAQDIADTFAQRYNVFENALREAMKRAESDHAPSTEDRTEYAHARAALAQLNPVFTVAKRITEMHRIILNPQQSRPGTKEIQTRFIEVPVIRIDLILSDRELRSELQRLSDAMSEFMKVSPEARAEAFADAQEESKEEQSRLDSQMEMLEKIYATPPETKLI